MHQKIRKLICFSHNIFNNILAKLQSKYNFNVLILRALNFNSNLSILNMSDNDLSGSKAQSNVNNSHQKTSNRGNKLKIAHRTRSKYQITDLNVAEIELPDDIFLDNNNGIPRYFNHGQHSSSNLTEPASTPSILEDPQDDLWMEFLNR